MSRSYHEIMERVEVTEEMRTRILGKIKSNENSSGSKNSPLAAPHQKSPSRGRLFSSFYPQRDFPSPAYGSKTVRAVG